MNQVPCLHEHLANAARVTYPAALQRCKLDAPLLAAGLLTTMDVFGDNKGAAGEEFPELLEYMEEVLPEKQEENEVTELTDIVIDMSEYYGETAENDRNKWN